MRRRWRHRPLRSLRERTKWRAVARMRRAEVEFLEWDRRERGRHIVAQTPSGIEYSFHGDPNALADPAFAEAFNAMIEAVYTQFAPLPHHPLFHAGPAPEQEAT